MSEYMSNRTKIQLFGYYNRVVVSLPSENTRNIEGENDPWKWLGE